MRAFLREHVRVKGETTRNPEIASIDWGKRIVVLPDGRWMPFENIIVSEPPPTGIQKFNARVAAEREDAESRRAEAMSPPDDNEPPLEWECRKCKRKFPSREAFQAHKGGCK